MKSTLRGEYFVKNIQNKFNIYIYIYIQKNERIEISLRHVQERGNERKWTT